MNKIIFITIISLFLASCSHLKSYKTETNVERRQESSSVVSKKTTERVDSTIKIQRDSVVAVRHLDDLLHGKPIEARDGNNTVRVTYDQETGNVQATGITEAHELPVEIERTTIETEKKDEVQTAKKEVTKEKKESEPFGMQSLIIYLLVIIGLYGLLFIFLFYRRPRDRLS